MYFIRWPIMVVLLTSLRCKQCSAPCLTSLQALKQCWTPGWPPALTLIPFSSHDFLTSEGPTTKVGTSPPKYTKELIGLWHFFIFFFLIGSGGCNFLKSLVSKTNICLNEKKKLIFLLILSDHLQLNCTKDVFPIHIYIFWVQPGRPEVNVEVGRKNSTGCSRVSSHSSPKWAEGGGVVRA